MASFFFCYEFMDLDSGSAPSMNSTQKESSLGNIQSSWPNQLGQCKNPHTFSNFGTKSQNHPAVTRALRHVGLLNTNKRFEKNKMQKVKLAIGRVFNIGLEFLVYFGISCDTELFFSQTPSSGSLKSFSICSRWESRPFRSEFIWSR